MSDANARLKSYVDRIERLREERKGLLDDERDIFVEVKSAGYDGKALRRVLQRRAADPAALADLDAMVEVYEAALEGKNRVVEAIRGGASIRQAAKAGGVSVGTAAALAMGVQNSVRIEHHPETGEITDADDCERATIAALIEGHPIENGNPRQVARPSQAAGLEGASPHTPYPAGVLAGSAPAASDDSDASGACPAPQTAGAVNIPEMPGFLRRVK